MTRVRAALGGPDEFLTTSLNDGDGVMHTPVHRREVGSAPTEFVARRAAPLHHDGCGESESGDALSAFRGRRRPGAVAPGRFSSCAAEGRSVLCNDRSRQVSPPLFL